MAATETQVEAVRAAVAPVVAALGCTLYDVELSGSGRSRTLRVVLDRPGGIDLDTIAEATRAVSPVLDAQPALAGPYLLEVTSPGVERTLRRSEHFEGARGEVVTVKFHTPDGPRRVRGTLAALDVDGGTITVDSDGERVTVALADVTQARTVFEWGGPSRPGRSSSRRRPQRAKERS